MVSAEAAATATRRSATGQPSTCSRSCSGVEGIIGHAPRRSQPFIKLSQISLRQHGFLSVRLRNVGEIVSPHLDTDLQVYK